MLCLTICAGSILLSRQNSNPTAWHTGLRFWLESPGLGPENLYVLILPRDLSVSNVVSLTMAPWETQVCSGPLQRVRQLWPESSLSHSLKFSSTA